MMGNSRGVSGTELAKHWLEARLESGLEAGPGRPFLPCPTEGGKSSWGVDGLSSTEAGRWINFILEEEGLMTEGSGEGVHRCKHTILSWAAKFGISRDHRRTLGVHVAKGDVTAVGYAHDELVHPVRLVKAMLTAIEVGDCHPDQSRGVYFKEGAGAGTDLCKDLEPHGDEVKQKASEKEKTSEETKPESESSSSESDSTDSSSNELAKAGGSSKVLGDNAVMAAVKYRRRNLKASDETFVHSSFGTFHLAMSEVSASIRVSQSLLVAASGLRSTRQPNRLSRIVCALCALGWAIATLDCDCATFELTSDVRMFE